MRHFRRRAGVATGRAALAQSAYRITEHDHAVVVARWAEIMGRGPIRPLRHLYAIPNGGLRSKATAGKLRAEGVRPGVSDYHLPVAAGGPDGRQLFNGLFLELKPRGGVLSPAQKAWLAAMAEEGHYAVVAWEADAAMEALLDYLTVFPGARERFTGRDPSRVRRTDSGCGWWEYRLMEAG